jgi:uncharacterized protein
MHHLELSHDPLRTVMIVLDPGEDPITAVTEVAGSAALDAAHFTAIGGFEGAVLGWFDIAAKAYRRITVDEQVEILSLIGDVTRAEPASGGIKVHGHAVLGRRDGSTVGGHLLSGRVRPTLELMLTETPAHLRRRHDPTTGLALIDLDRSAASAGAAKLEEADDPHRR